MEIISAEKERCTKQRAQIVVRSVKFLLNQQKADLFIAGIASRSTDQREAVHRAIRLAGSGGLFLLVSGSSTEK